jgi:hypothetical protein
MDTRLKELLDRNFGHEFCLSFDLRGTNAIWSDLASFVAKGGSLCNARWSPIGS